MTSLPGVQLNDRNASAGGWTELKFTYLYLSVYLSELQKTCTLGINIQHAAHRFSRVSHGRYRSGETSCAA